MFSTQCAAVTTQLGLNNEPPQKGPLVISIACHGHELGAAWYPPTIRERGRTPHPSLKNVDLDRIPKKKLSEEVIARWLRSHRYF